VLAVLAMRERALDLAGNRAGLSGQPRRRVCASDEVHTSVDRAFWIRGIGADNPVRILTQGPLRSMDAAALRAAIAADWAAASPSPECRTASQSGFRQGSSVRSRPM